MGRLDTPVKKQLMAAELAHPEANAMAMAQR
eukprot:SAG22_NODE_55_length_23749_cov_24.622918_6_plen_31_part_00